MSQGRLGQVHTSFRNQDGQWNLQQRAQARYKEGLLPPEIRRDQAGPISEVVPLEGGIPHFSSHGLQEGEDVSESYYRCERSRSWIEYTTVRDTACFACKRQFSFFLKEGRHQACSPHWLCQECMSRYVSDRIENKKVLPICPLCGHPYSAEDIARITQHTEVLELQYEQLHKAYIQGGTHRVTLACGHSSLIPSLCECEWYCVTCEIPGCLNASLIIKAKDDVVVMKVDGHSSTHRIDLCAFPDCETCYTPLTRSDWLLHLCLPCSDHAVCRECLRGHTKACLEDNKPYRCPGDECQIALACTELDIIHGDAAQSKKAFRKEMDRAMQCRPELYPCLTPDCEGILDRKILAKEESAEVECTVCKKKITFKFSTKDPYGSINQDIEGIKMLKKKLKKGEIKHCPGCRALIYRYAGCQYMRCSVCKFGFCWHCLEEASHSEHEFCRKRKTTEDQLDEDYEEFDKSAGKQCVLQ